MLAVEGDAMIRALQTKNFRMLADNFVELGPLHVLVGQNATGKSTFLGAIQLLSNILNKGLTQAVKDVGPNLYDLCFDSQRPIEIAVEVSVPSLQGEAYFRYELQFGIGGPKKGLRIMREWLFKIPPPARSRPSLFSSEQVPPVLVHDRAPRSWRKVVAKTEEGRDYFRDEKTSWNNMFRFGPDRAALASLPEDPDRFPLAIRVRDLLRDEVRTLELSARKLRDPSPPGGTARMEMDGSNLPYVVADLKDRDPVLLKQWVEHLATGVHGLLDVSVRERPEDRYLILEAKFAGTHKDPIPSWLLSDGTLRLMALTLISYAATAESRGAYLIEEPENGLHPLAIQAAFQALASPPAESVQILCATHSPIFLAHVPLEKVLVFRRSADGSSAVRHGEEVPELENWAGRKNLSDLFVTGVLA